MLTLKDCIEYSELTEEEIEAIAEHEHLPFIVAAEMGGTLLGSEQGIRCIQRFIREDIQHAKACGMQQKATDLRRVYRHFVKAHPLPH